MRLTERVHNALKQHLRAGDWAVDATMGNGHDAVFLSKCVGSTGKVWAFDIQESALQSTQTRLSNEHAQAELIHASHADLDQHLPDETVGKIHAIVFNLGYLPGHDKSVTTEATSTLLAIEKSFSLLAPNGAIHILCYTGHPQGLAEWQAIQSWSQSQAAEQWSIQQHSPFDPEKRPPVWIQLNKI